MRKKIMIANGSYTAQDGSTKTNWKEVGVIMTSQAGKEFCLLDPTVNLSGFPREPGKDMIIASIFEDKPKGQPQQNQNQGYQQPQQQQGQYQASANGGYGGQQPQQQNQQQQPVYDQDGQEIPI